MGAVATGFTVKYQASGTPDYMVSELWSARGADNDVCACFPKRGSPEFRSELWCYLSWLISLSFVVGMRVAMVMIS